MQIVQQMLSSTPNAPVADRRALHECIDACLECAAACTACADACLGEEQVAALRRCIRLNEDCADTCALMARVLSRQTVGDTAFPRALLETCGRICAACGAECQRHAKHHEHCRICAEMCRQCEEQCGRMTRALPASA
jgi:hypothetical protein